MIEILIVTSIIVILHALTRILVVLHGIQIKNRVEKLPERVLYTDLQKLEQTLFAVEIVTVLDLNMNVQESRDGDNEEELPYLHNYDWMKCST